MKTSFPGIIVLLIGLALLSSCSKAVYTHQQVMQSFHTKSDVEKQFGFPDETIKGDGIEMWTYNRDTTRIAGIPNKRDTVISVGSDSLHADHPVQHTNYIKFSFDTAGYVTGYKTNGVNMAYTKKDNFGKGVVNVLGVTAAIIVIVGVEIASDGNFNW